MSLMSVIIRSMSSSEWTACRINASSSKTSSFTAPCRYRAGSSPSEAYRWNPRSAPSPAQGRSAGCRNREPSCCEDRRVRWVNFYAPLRSAQSRRPLDVVGPLSPPAGKLASASGLLTLTSYHFIALSGLRRPCCLILLWKNGKRHAILYSKQRRKEDSGCRKRPCGNEYRPDNL